MAQSKSSQKTCGKIGKIEPWERQKDIAAWHDCCPEFEPSGTRNFHWHLHIKFPSWILIHVDTRLCICNTCVNESGRFMNHHIPPNWCYDKTYVETPAMWLQPVKITSLCGHFQFLRNPIACVFLMTLAKRLKGTVLLTVNLTNHFGQLNCYDLLHCTELHDWT